MSQRCLTGCRDRKLNYFLTALPYITVAHWLAESSLPGMVWNRHECANRWCGVFFFPATRNILNAKLMYETATRKRRGVA